MGCRRDDRSAVAATVCIELTARHRLLQLRGSAFWQQFYDIGPIIGDEIAAFFADRGLVDAFAEGRDCTDLYGPLGRTPNWRRAGGVWVHQPNAVSRAAMDWGGEAAAAGSDSEQECGSGALVGGGGARPAPRDADTQRDCDTVRAAALSFAYSPARRAFLLSRPGDLSMLFWVSSE